MQATTPHPALLCIPLVQRIFRFSTRNSVLSKVCANNSTKKDGVKPAQSSRYKEHLLACQNGTATFNLFSQAGEQRCGAGVISSLVLLSNVCSVWKETLHEYGVPVLLDTLLPPRSSRTNFIEFFCLVCARDVYWICELLVRTWVAAAVKVRGSSEDPTTIASRLLKQTRLCGGFTALHVVCDFQYLVHSLSAEEFFRRLMLNGESNHSQTGGGEQQQLQQERQSWFGLVAKIKQQRVYREGCCIPYAPSTIHEFQRESVRLSKDARTVETRLAERLKIIDLLVHIGRNAHNPHTAVARSCSTSSHGFVSFDGYLYSALTAVGVAIRTLAPLDVINKVVLGFERHRPSRKNIGDSNALSYAAASPVAPTRTTRYSAGIPQQHVRQSSTDYITLCMLASYPEALRFFAAPPLNLVPPGGFAAAIAPCARLRDAAVCEVLLEHCFVPAPANDSSNNNDNNNNSRSAKAIALQIAENFFRAVEGNSSYYTWSMEQPDEITKLVDTLLVILRWQAPLVADVVVDMLVMSPIEQQRFPAVFGRRIDVSVLQKLLDSEPSFWPAIKARISVVTLRETLRGILVDWYYVPDTHRRLKMFQTLGVTVQSCGLVDSMPQKSPLLFMFSHACMQRRTMVSVSVEIACNLLEFFHDSCATRDQAKDMLLARDEDGHTVLTHLTCSEELIEDSEFMAMAKRPFVRLLLAFARRACGDDNELEFLDWLNHAAPNPRRGGKSMTALQFFGSAYRDLRCILEEYGATK